LEHEVALPKLKLVSRDNEEQRSTNPLRHDGFFQSWYQEAQGLSRLASTLVGLLINAVLVGVFLIVWIKLQPWTSPQMPMEAAPEYVASSSLYVFSKPGLIKANRVGACAIGTRVKVIGTATVDGQVWYEIEILSEHPKNLDSLKQKWVLGARLVMTRS